MTDTGDRVLAVIPARAGSRGLPGKHIRLLGGEPVIVHTFRAAADAARVTDILVSTNDPAVRSVAEAFGAPTPFVRPAALSTDQAPTPPVIAHALDWYERSAGARVDIVVTLQPTSPLRSAAEIDAAIALLDDPSVDSAVSVAPIGVAVSALGFDEGGRWRPLMDGGDPRRQASPAALRLTGGIYVSRRHLLDEGRLVGRAAATLLVDRVSGIDVDNADDLREARAAWRRRQ